MTSFEDVLKNAKTFLELQIAYRNIFDKEPILEADKIGRIASLNLFNNSKWVSVGEVEKLQTQLQELYLNIPNYPESWKQTGKLGVFILEVYDWKKKFEKLLGCVKETEKP